MYFRKWYIFLGVFILNQLESQINSRLPKARKQRFVASPFSLREVAYMETINFIRQ